MVKGIKFETPNPGIQEYFEQVYHSLEAVYQTLAPNEYAELSQTGIYGKCSIGDVATEFMLYEGEDNKIGIIFKNIVSRNGKFEDEIKIIFIDSSTEAYLNDYTHYMIIIKGKDSITTLEALKKANSKKDYRFTSKKYMRPQEKITILFQQNDTIESTVIKETAKGKVYKTKKWEDLQAAYSESTKQKLEDGVEKYLETGKKLPIWFGDEVNENRKIIEEILKKYHDEQIYEANREKIEVFFNQKPDSSEPKSPTCIRKS